MSRAGRVALGALIGVLLAAGLFGSGLAFGALSPQIQRLGTEWLLPRLPGALQVTPSAGAAAGAPSSSVQQLFEPFWQAWDTLHREYVDQPVDDVTLMRGAIRGMLDSLGDQHTAYMDPDQYRQATIPLIGAYEGIGAWVDKDADYLTIVAPIPGSPAERAGLKPGDKVIAVDGVDMTGVDGSLVVQKLLGPKGTSVKLTLLRKGQADPITVEIVRESITVPSVQSRMLRNDIGYVRLLTFGEGTTADLRSALTAILKQKPKGLILDLRGNGGGYLNTAVDVASEFIPSGVILTERFGNGKETVYRAKEDGLATTLPLVVLVDGGTASASEIVAGALQDYGRAKLVGEKTFGKGSVQDWQELTGDNGAIRVTIARWYTPKGRQINEKGLQPDVAIPLTDADRQAGRDPQLDGAIELLLK